MKLSEEIRATALEQVHDEFQYYCFKTPDFSRFLEAVDKLEQGMIALETETEGIDKELLALNNRVRSLEIDCIRVMAERDALAEIHKQVIREVLNGKTPRDIDDKETPHTGTPVQKG